MAFPGTLVVDLQGRVTSRFFEDFYIDRNTVSSLLVKLGSNTDSSVAATKVSTNHLDMTTYASDAALAPGNRFSLIAAVAPHVRRARVDHHGVADGLLLVSETVDARDP